MVKININFGNKTFYLLVGILGLVLLAGFVLALEQWEIHGHSANEIEGGTGGANVVIKSESGVDFINDVYNITCDPGYKAISCTTLDLNPQGNTPDGQTCSNQDNKCTFHWVEASTAANKDKITITCTCMEESFVTFE